MGLNKNVKPGDLVIQVGCGWHDAVARGDYGIALEVRPHGLSREEARENYHGYGDDGKSVRVYWFYDNSDSYEWQEDLVVYE